MQEGIAIKNLYGTPVVDCRSSNFGDFPGYDALERLRSRVTETRTLLDRRKATFTA
jgi:hypothetical protein